MNENIVFSEEQGFSRSWIRYGLPFFLALAVLIFGIQVFTKQENLSELIFAIVLLAFLSLFILSIRLETVIRTDGIYVRFYPFHLKFQYYSWNMIKAAYIRQYNPLSEYGGWGIRTRLLLGNNWAYNLSGTSGIQLVFKNGNTLLIGTRKPLEAAEALKRLGKLHHVE